MGEVKGIHGAWEPNIVQSKWSFGGASAARDAATATSLDGTVV